MLVADATLITDKAERYLKALCNRFNRKVTAEYTDNHGTVQFGFAYCEMEASANALVFRIQAEDEEKFGQVKYVVEAHLKQFSSGDLAPLEWVAPS